MRTAAALLLAVVLGACGAEERTCLERVATAPDGAFVAEVRREADARIVRYRDGEEVRLPLAPKRIVSTLPGITRTLVWMGAEAQIVGISPHCDALPTKGDVTRLSVMPLDLETLRALAPDLVVVDGVVKGMGVQGLGDAAPVLRLESRSLAHWRTSIQLLAEVLGTEEAERARVRYDERMEALRPRAKPEGAAPRRVLLVASAEPLYVLGPGSLLDDVVRACGATNVACDLGRASGPFSEEVALARAPDVVISLVGKLPPRLHERWASMPAVQAGHVFEGRPQDRMLQAGPGTPDTVRVIDTLIWGVPGAGDR